MHGTKLKLFLCKFTILTLISGFRRDVDDFCALLGCYAASCGNFFTDVSVQRIGPIFTGQESEQERKKESQLPVTLILY
jgi:hypothetical protein